MSEQKIKYTAFTPDSIVQSVVEKFVDRAEMGFNKYNNTLDRKDLTTEEWINHALEEHMDAILYLTKLKEIIKNA
jgi:hypothetical protein